MEKVRQAEEGAKQVREPYIKLGVSEEDYTS